MRTKLLAQDAKGNWVRVRLVIRRGAAYDCMSLLQVGARVRVVGELALSEAAGEEETRAHLWMNVDSAVRLEGAERTKHSLFERLFTSFKFWSTK